MFIYIAYKDAPELSRTVSRDSVDSEQTAEKILLVNPNCPVRIMLEYIRKKCKLGIYTNFDLCDHSGFLMSLFSLATYVNASEQFVHKRTYYIIVLKNESDKTTTVFPQLNHDNLLYNDLKIRVQKCLTGELEPLLEPPGKVTPPSGKTNTPTTGKGKK